MAKIPGTNVASPIAPFTTDDQFPTHDAIYGKGGQREVATIAERDAIPSARLTEGCTCYVAATEKTYRWKSNAWVDDTPEIASDASVISYTPSGSSTPTNVAAALDSKASTSALTEGLAGKQGTISDLETIRSGAGKGATSVQGVKMEGDDDPLTPGVDGVVTIPQPEIPDSVTSVLANNELVFQTPGGQSVKGKVGITTGADGLLHLTLTDEEGNTYSSPIAGLRVDGNALQYSNDGEIWTTVQTFGKLTIKYVQASDPASGDVGDLALVGSTNAYVLKVYVGGSWVSVGDIGTLDLTSDGITMTGENKTLTQKIVGLDGAVSQTKIQELKTIKGFQFSANNQTTALYSTGLNLVKGKRYKIRVTASKTYSNNTTVFLQIVSGQYEGQKSIGNLAANTLTTEFDYTCIDDNLQYLGTYASGIHTVTYSIFIFEYIGINDVVENIAPKTNYYDYFMAMNTHVIATSSLTRAKCISVYAGQKVKVKANQQNSAQICFLTSLPATLSNSMDLSSYVISSHSVASGEEETFDVPSDATLLWVNILTYYNNTFSIFEPEALFAYGMEHPVEVSDSDNDFEITDENDVTVVSFNEGHLRTKHFNSKEVLQLLELSQRLIKAGMQKLADVILIPVYGQSLATGGDTTKLTNSFIYPTKSGNQPNLTTSFGANVEVSSYGLVDSIVHEITNNELFASIPIPKFVSFARGHGSTSIIGLKKGTTFYNELLGDIASANTTAINSGKSLIVPAFCWVQGEADRTNGHTTDYKGELETLRQDLDADIKAITGQTEDVHCILYQTNQLTVLSDDSSWNSYSYDSVSASRMVVPTAQYELIRDNPYFHASSPVYPMDFYVSQNGAMIHITKESQRLLGYYEGLAAYRLLLSNNHKNGLYVKNMTKVDSTHIRLELAVPYPPVVIDNELVAAVENLGFSVITQSNGNILTDVDVVNHGYLCEVTLTTSSECSGSKVRYACNGTVGKSGKSQGARGNLRDSQGELFKATIGSQEVRLDNWLYSFEIIV